MYSSLIFGCYVEVDLFVSKMLLQDLFDIGFSIENCDTHVFVCFDHDNFVVLVKLIEGMIVKACDVGS